MIHCRYSEFVSLGLFHVCLSSVCLKPIRSFRDCMSVCARRLQVAAIEIQLGVLQVQSGSYSYRGFGKVCSTVPPLFHSRMWVNCCSSQRHPQYTPIELWWVKVQDPERKTPRNFGFWFFYRFCFFCLFEMVWVLLDDLLKVSKATFRRAVKLPLVIRALQTQGSHLTLPTSQVLFVW